MIAAAAIAGVVALVILIFIEYVLHTFSAQDVRRGDHRA